MFFVRKTAFFFDYGGQWGFVARNDLDVFPNGSMADPYRGIACMENDTVMCGQIEKRDIVIRCVFLQTIPCVD